MKSICGRPCKQLVASEVVYQRGIGAHTTYFFKHALLQEAAYQSMLKSTRQHMHRQTADTLVAQFPAIVRTHPEVIAAHYTAAGSAEETLGYWQQASATAEAQAAYREAAMHVQQALAILQHLPETPDRLVQAIDFRLELRRIILPLWELERELAVLREAETLAPRLAEISFLAGRCEEALYYADQQLEFAREHGERGRQAWVYRLRGEIALCAGRQESALAESSYQQALALARELGMRPLQAHCQHSLGVLYSQRGQADGAYEALIKAFELYREMAMTFWIPQDAPGSGQVQTTSS